jgi:ABC-type multidrug transport system fused ATPase/permease subunit
MAMSTVFADSKIATYAGIMALFIPCNVLFFVIIKVIALSVQSILEV